VSGRGAPSAGRSLVAHIDGGARGNPGPAGYGVHVAERDGVAVAQIYGFLGIATNNTAEYAALLALLEYAASVRPGDLLILSDSELLIRQMQGRYRVKDPKLKILHAAARRLIDLLPRVELRHVPREENRDADALANRAMDTRESTAPLPAAVAALKPTPSQNSLI
jgi:ribonuclease HI